MKSAVPETKRLLVRAKMVITCDTDAPQCGIDFEALGRIDNAAMLIEDGIITSLCHPELAEGRHGGTPSPEELDLGNCIIVPGFVDAHAHPLYAGNREPDFAARTRGDPPPLGMRYTIEQTREALLD